MQYQDSFYAIPAAFYAIPNINMVYILEEKNQGLCNLWLIWEHATSSGDQFNNVMWEKEEKFVI